MPSTPSPIGNVELFEEGEKLLWGDDQTQVMRRLTEMSKGVKVIALAGSRALTSTNYVDSEYRYGTLIFSGGSLTGPATVTVPAQQNKWLVVNNEPYSISFSAGGLTAAVDAGKIAELFCDGTDIRAWSGYGVGDGLTVKSDRAALKSTDTDQETTALVRELNREGVFRWDGSDRSNDLIVRSLTTTAVNSGTGVLTKTAHELYTGYAVLVTAAVNGLAVNTIYYAIRVSTSTFKLASSWSNAIAGTAVTLTATTNVTLKLLLDPEEAVYVTKSGGAKDGSAGAWVRAYGDLFTADFGVTHDGVTDDTRAFRAATFFIGAVGGVLRINPGDCLFDTATASDLTARGIGPYNWTIQNASGFKILGAGGGKTRLMTGPNGNLSVIGFVMNCHDFEIGGFDAVGDTTGLVGLSGALMIYSCRDYYVHDIDPEGFLGSYFVGNFQFNGTYENINAVVSDNASLFDVASWQNMTVRKVTAVGNGGQGFQHIYDSPNDNPAFNETGIVLEDDFSNGLLIDDCDFSGLTTGIALQDIDDVMVRASRLHDNKDASGDYIGGMAVGLSPNALSDGRTLRNINLLDSLLQGNGSTSGTAGLRGGLVVNSSNGSVHIAVRGCKFFDNKDTGIVFVGAAVTFEHEGNEFANVDTADQAFDWSGAPILKTVMHSGLAVPDTGSFLVGAYDALGAWTSFASTMTASAGTITSSSVTAHYKRIGKTVICRFGANDITNGTGAGILQLSLPFAAATGAVAKGWQTSPTGKIIGGYVGLGSSTLNLSNADGTYPGASGVVMQVEVIYQTA